MGWLSDKLFGKKKRINQNKINTYMEPFNNMVNEQEGIFRDMMDPNSVMNVKNENFLRQNTFDMANLQNRNTSSMGIMNNMSPAQILAQNQANTNRIAGNFGSQMHGIRQDAYNQGLLGLQNVMGWRKGEGERLANAHINQINAHNARRASRMNMTTGLLGSALGFAGNFIPQKVQQV